MKIGLILKDERYWSLRKMNESILNCLKSKYEVSFIYLKDGKTENQKLIDSLYIDCDIVIYMASKLINYKRVCEKPTLFFTHAWMDHGAGINFYVNERTFGHNDYLIFTSTSTKNKFNQVYSTNIGKLVIPYFTTDIKLKISNAEENSLRAKYKIPEKSKILIYFGRFSPEKNIEALFEMARSIKGENFVILVVGDFTAESTFGFGDIDKASYIKKIQKMILAEKSGKVLFISRVDDYDLRQLLSIAFVSINPTLCLEEDFSLSTIESMSAGVPVVASAWGGIKDIVRHGKDGFLMKSYFCKEDIIKLDIGGAVKHIDVLLLDEDRREKQSRNSLERCRLLFSEAAFLKKLNPLLARMTSSKSKKNEIYIYPKNKYRLIYDSALKCKRTDRIYLDNPGLFKDLYKNYLGNKQ